MVFHVMPGNLVKSLPFSCNSSCNLLLEQGELGFVLNTFSRRMGGPLPHSWGIGELPELNLDPTPKCNPCPHFFFFYWLFYSFTFQMLFPLHKIPILSSLPLLL